MVASRNVMVIQTHVWWSVTLGKARRGCFSQCNGGADVVQTHVWCSVTLGTARRGCFWRCNGGADVVQTHVWCSVTLGEARHGCFSQCNAGVMLGTVISIEKQTERGEEVEMSEN